MKKEKVKKNKLLKNLVKNIKLNHKQPIMFSEDADEYDSNKLEFIDTEI